MIYFRFFHQIDFVHVKSNLININIIKINVTSLVT